MRKIIVVLALLLIFGGCGINKLYFPSVDTGKNAEMRETDLFRKNDTIILDKRYYVSPEDSENNINFRASDKAQAKEAFCNFGDKGGYTLYEMESVLDFPIYADNYKLVIFVEDINEKKFLDHYLDYNNYTFSVCSKNKKDTYEVKFEDDFINTLSNKYSGDSGESFDVKKAEELRIVPLSKDGLVERDTIYLYEKDGEYYWENAFRQVSKLSEEESRKMSQALK